MRKKMSKKVCSVALAAAMVMSLGACTPKEAPTDPVDPVDPVVDPVDPDVEVSPYTIYKDADGNTIDLGGMEIIIRDWWTSEEKDPETPYQEAVQEYHEWLMETYNFKMSQKAISDWGTTPQDFIDYCTSGGDSTNYVFTLYATPAIASAMTSGLLYDLSTLDCLDFTDTKFTSNYLHKQFSIGDSYYAMYAGTSEARTGVYFNKQVLADAGIDPESLYDMQKDGTWTFEAFADMMAKVQRDLDGDGIDDVYGLTVNESNMTNQAIYSNGGAYVTKNDAGEYVYSLEDPATLEALEWVVEMYKLYDNHDPEGVDWEYYKEEFRSGKVGFMVEDAYAGGAGNFLDGMEDEVGFVMFPTGPKVEKGHYVNCWTNNLAVIPGCYDADRAWKIAFAWNLWTNQPNGYEDFLDLSSYKTGKLGDDKDGRAIDETIMMMMSAEHGMVAYHDLIPGIELGPQFTWGVGWYTVVSEKVEEVREIWNTCIDKMNGK